MECQSEHPSRKIQNGLLNCLCHLNFSWPSEPVVIYWFIVHNGIQKHHWCLIYSISDLTKLRQVSSEVYCSVEFHVSNYNCSGVKWTYYVNLG
jgi:hypothetical protein